MVLGVLVVLQWAVTAGIALNVQHNGWLYYHGGDGTYYWTTAWALAHHVVPKTIISYGLPVFFWPLGRIFGTSMLAGLPAVVVLQVALLAPLGVVAFYLLAQRIAGRLFAAAAATMWVMSPLVVLAYIRPDVRPRFGAIALPGTLGLTNLADYPSMILAIVVAWLVLRAIDERGWNDVVLAGLACGFLLGMKPSNAFFLPAPICAFLVARRWRDAAIFAVALLPALITLTLWKKIGLGHVPLLADREVRLAASREAFYPTLRHQVSVYLPFDWHRFTTNLSGIREYGWSLRMAEWIPIAGLIGAFRRGRPHAVLLGLWFVGYMIVKGATRGRAPVLDLSYFRLTMPAFPAYVLLAACVVFLLPGRSRQWRPRAPRPASRRSLLALAATIAVLVVYPFGFILTAHAAPRGEFAEDIENHLVPIEASLQPSVRRVGRKVELRWKPPPVGSSKVRYLIYRGPDDGCTYAAGGGALDCLFSMPKIASVRGTSWTGNLRKGTYRIGLVAGALARGKASDLLMLSTPVQAPR